MQGGYSASFHMSGNVPVSMLRLHIFVKDDMTAGPESFNISTLIPSRPVALELDMDSPDLFLLQTRC